MLTDATNSLIATAGDATATDADMNAAAQAFFDAVGRASLDEANGAMRALSAHFDLEDASRSGFLALVCGALVERGCDPLAIAQTLIQRVASLLESSAVLAIVCLAQIPKSEDEDQDAAAVFQETRQQMAPSMARENAAWPRPPLSCPSAVRH